MKEIYAERIIKDDGLFRALFEIVWNNRKKRRAGDISPRLHRNEKSNGTNAELRSRRKSG